MVYAHVNTRLMDKISDVDCEQDRERRSMVEWTETVRRPATVTVTHIIIIIIICLYYDN